MKVVIVGGVAGGASAGARLRRLDESAEIIMFERGEFISFANCGLPYYIGEEIKERDDLLVATPQLFRERFNIDVRTETEVMSIDRENKRVRVRNMRENREYEEGYDYLLLSPGASPIKPPLSGIDMDSIYTLRNIPDMDKIVAFVRERCPRSAVVIGGGFIGLEMAENLKIKGLDVTLIEMLDQVMAPLDFEMAAIVHEYLVNKGIKLNLGDGVKSFRKEDGVTVVTTSAGKEFRCDLVILSIGVVPESTLARNAGLELGLRGSIRVDSHMRTSDPYIFAVGDAVEVKDFVSGKPAVIPLAGPANKQGRIAADNMAGRKSVYRGTQGTAIAKVFDMVVGSTGNNGKQLKADNILYRSAHIHSSSHASYYPGAMPMVVKILFTPSDGKLLGAQIVGGEGVDKRIDVFATAIRAGMTVFDLEELELSYAPPFSSAKDPVNMIGYVASNILKGDVETINWDETDCIDREKQGILDVRNNFEVKTSGALEGSIHIPLNELRGRLNELDKNREYVVYCASGLRSYIACRMMSQNGFRVKNLSGGYKTYIAPRKELGTTLEKTCRERESYPEGKVVAEIKPSEIKPDFEINAQGLQCPGPILKLKEKLDVMALGQVVKITATDTGFPGDVRAWCNTTGNTLIGVESGPKGSFTAMVTKGVPGNLVVEKTAPGGQKEVTLIVFSDDLDRALASFIIANGAASIGSRVSMFFTFWGLNVLKKKTKAQEKKDMLSSMFGAMMPRGADSLALSKMHFMGLGTGMMKYVMENKNVESLDALIESARSQGVRLIACTMTMEIMGIRKSELMDGVEEGGVASYLESASMSNVNLFI